MEEFKFFIDIIARIGAVFFLIKFNSFGENTKDGIYALIYINILLAIHV